MLTVMTTLCQQILKTQEWPEMWSKYLIITIPKKEDLKKCENYRTISLICHTSKILIRIIINRMNPQAEEILTEEQAGIRKKKKAFDIVWHEGLWNVMRQFNIQERLICLIESLY